MISKSDLQTSQRDLRFDTLRGLFLVCMTVNHLPTELRYFTDQSLGTFSAADARGSMAVRASVLREQFRAALLWLRACGYGEQRLGDGQAKEDAAHHCATDC